MIHHNSVTKMVQNYVQNAAGQWYYQYTPFTPLESKPTSAKNTMGLTDTKPMGDTLMMRNMRAGSMQLTNSRKLQGSIAGPSFIVPPVWLYNWSKRQGNSITNMPSGGM